MDIDLSGLAATVNVIASSALNLEMAVRLGQSLEMTDGLSDLLPIVVAAGERLDERPAAEAADLSPAARGLDSATRARLRRLGDECTASLNATIVGQPVDGDALVSLTQDPAAAARAVRDRDGNDRALDNPAGTAVDVPGGTAGVLLAGRPEA